MELQGGGLCLEDWQEMKGALGTSWMDRRDKQRCVNRQGMAEG